MFRPTGTVDAHYSKRLIKNFRLGPSGEPREEQPVCSGRHALEQREWTRSFCGIPQNSAIDSNDSRLRSYMAFISALVSLMSADVRNRR